MGGGVWAAGVKFGSDPGLVADFDEEVAPALLDQLPLSRAGVHLDTRFGVDVDIQEALSVKDLLHFGNGNGGVCFAKRLIESFLHLRRKRFAKIILGLNESLNLRLQRLKCHIMDFRK